jgi:hypothetical protein
VASTWSEAKRTPLDLGKRRERLALRHAIEDEATGFVA